MLKYAKAFKDNIIRKFSIKPVEYFILGSAQPNAQLDGELKNSHNGIVFKMNGIEQIVEKAMELKLQLSNERFNICFTTNLNSFDIQFMALHKLYNILIKNQKRSLSDGYHSLNLALNGPISMSSGNFSNSKIDIITD